MPATLPGPRGISCFLVEKDNPGLHIGKPESKMGLRGSSTVQAELENCRVPESALLGDLHQGFRIAMMALDGGRIGVSAQAIGIATAALDEAVAYARERRQFGRPIADFQAIQWMLADSRTELDAARMLCLRAATLKEAGRPFSTEAAMSKVFSTEAAGRICDRALQVHGGYGYVREFAAERHVRDVRVTRIYEGTSEVQRVVIRALSSRKGRGSPRFESNLLAVRPYQMRHRHLSPTRTVTLLLPVLLAASAPRRTRAQVGRGIAHRARKARARGAANSSDGPACGRTCHLK